MKKSKSSGQSVQVPRCQVEGCDLDLSSAKDYHRKHRVCESHSKCPKVIVCGLERRFCQQCSRFHALSEFDEKKRSCRKRLSHHNARRRKPQGAFPLNPAAIYDRRQQETNALWNELSHNRRSGERYGWGTTFGVRPKPAESGGFTLSFQRGDVVEEQLFSSRSQSVHSYSAAQNGSGFSTGKPSMIGFQLPGKGVEETSVNSGANEAQHLHRALSLLSFTSPRTPREPPMLIPTSDAFPTLFI